MFPWYVCTIVHSEDDLTCKGRAWSYAELSIKSFNDLHKLYWLCVKEQNQILTRSKEMRRVRAGYGQVEVDEKLKIVSCARSFARNLNPMMSLILSLADMSATRLLKPCIHEQIYWKVI